MINKKAPPIKMKAFAQYLKMLSFDEALHHARQLSHERVIANDQTLETGRHEISQPQQPQKAATG